MDYDEVADELYGLHPDEFMAARTAREREARAGGDRALAAAIKALGKPSTPAWVANVLVRHQREEIENLVELGGLLRDAQSSLAGDQLRALDVQRRQLVGALTRQARGIAAELGHPVSTGVAAQVEETLRAALADPDAGGALLAGRLTGPLSYSGLGTVDRPDLHLVRPPARPGPARGGPSRGERPARRGGDVDARRRAETERQEEARRAAEERRWRELAEARLAVAGAERDAEDAAEALDDARQRAEELAARHDGLLGRVEELTAELARTREECTRVGGERSRAERRRESAERRSTDAARTRDRARARVEQLDASDS
ncbi:hypothetical protein OF117_03250 [Geodermatophilus sp. YIM 151500]|uniref:hypothetical protein n=1 Tax=Geodermatophilus sp. YIM 151500 TaxID=2984531 RepID=UPI0021E37B29|nr:hypothetical protein [Geodermatophilus sp. YIM 151500]MCV2488367.1 hypothetical protein [Geodermatophilus sp. YIM 151500]